MMLRILGCRRQPFQERISISSLVYPVQPIHRASTRARSVREGASLEISHPSDPRTAQPGAMPRSARLGRAAHFCLRKRSPHSTQRTSQQALTCCLSASLSAPKEKAPVHPLSPSHPIYVFFPLENGMRSGWRFYRPFSVSPLYFQLLLRYNTSVT